VGKIEVWALELEDGKAGEEGVGKKRDLYPLI
jgi:hypothetical protein